MKKIVHITMCLLVISSILSLKPAVSLAAWWKPTTWFNDWTFEVPAPSPTNTTVPPVSVRTVSAPPVENPRSEPVPSTTSSVRTETPLSQLRTVTNPPTVTKPLIVSVTPRSVMPDTEVAVYGSNFIITGENVVVLTNKKYDTLSLNTTAASVIEIPARAASSSSKITFSMTDVDSISAGTYELSIKNSSGIKSNSVKFIVLESRMSEVKSQDVLPESDDAMLEDIKKEIL